MSTITATAVMTTAERVAERVETIREAYVQRTRAVRMQRAITSNATSYVRRALGWRFDAPAAERARLNARAVKIVEALAADESQEDEDAPIADAVRGFCAIASRSAAPWTQLRKDLEKELSVLARLLPVWPWVEGVHGLGSMALAIVVGEAGDLARFSGPYKLNKYLGIAVDPNGKAQGKRLDASAAAWNGYSPRRRSAIWTITDSLLKKPNKYQELYRERRATELVNHPEFDRGISKTTGKQQISKHGDRRARRVAEKAWVQDLWREWRKSAGLELSEAA